jgi:tight adherence protein C
MFLSSMVRRRQEAIIKKFPDALDLMSICVDAGLTFDGAMSKVDEKWDDPLAREFGRVIQEMQLGKTRRQSLRDMADRIDVADVSSFIAAILQADQLGVSIGKVLRIQSEQMRIRRRQRAEEKAHQAPVKMLFPMVFLIFPSMFIVLLGPAGFQVLRSSALGDI